jgi:ketosteroid isomerase-like protein
MTTTDAWIGDQLPPALAAYYASLDAGMAKEASESFSEAVRYEVPFADQIETAPRCACDGRDEVREHLERRTPRWAHRILLCVAHGPAALVEGLTVDRDSGEPNGSFAASVRIDRDQLISSYLTFRCAPAISPLPLEASAAPTSEFDAMAKIDEYFAALDDARFDSAAGCFSEDVVYSHPPYKDPRIGGPGRATFAGRAELAAAFHRRGRQDFDHEIVFSGQRGAHLLLEGVVHDAGGGVLGRFVSSATLDLDGLIRRYASFYCEEPAGNPNERAPIDS